MSKRVAKKREKMNRSEFVSVPEAADLLGCSTTWVLYLLNEGQLDGFKLSQKAWCVSRKSIKKNLSEYFQRIRERGKGRARSKFCGGEQ